LLTNNLVKITPYRPMQEVFYSLFYLLINITRPVLNIFMIVVENCATKRFKVNSNYLNKIFENIEFCQKIS
jgi:hypothetical protein